MVTMCEVQGKNNKEQTKKESVQWLAMKRMDYDELHLTPNEKT